MYINLFSTAPCHIFLLTNPVSPKGNQPWIFSGRTDAEAEAPILWPPDAKNQLIGKDPDAGKDWRQEEKGTTEDEMVGWHHWLNGHEFEQTPGDSEGPGSLVCCCLWGLRESDTTEQLNNNHRPSVTKDYKLGGWEPQKCTPFWFWRPGAQRWVVSRAALPLKALREGSVADLSPGFLPVASGFPWLVSRWLPPDPLRSSPLCAHLSLSKCPLLVRSVVTLD